ncbi:MAG: M14 family zinc carboxypeptidase, partial [Deltaproteobacteria bacterium]
MLANSVDIWEVNHEEGYVVAYLTSTEYQELISMGFTVVIDQERTSHIRNNLQLSPDQTGGIPGFPCYRTVEETHTSLEDLAASPPGLAAWMDSGDSWEKWFSGEIRGYDLHTLVLTNTSTPGPKPRLYIMAAIHAREYATAELAFRFAEYLVEKYDQDADITWLLDYYEVHITPIANPDGRKIAEGGIYWRKNVNNTDGCPNPNSWGTDLNRNSSFKWGLVGSSQDACSETFRGSAPASETETQAIQDYVSGIFADLR